ncbi:MAG: SPOR domain-containing protein [Bacteroidales bacterium]|jgi:nucleoid DNA-binding protein
MNANDEMDITAFIRELLFSHDCVILPGFGGFIGNYTPARMDKSNSTFYPPVKKISFNRNLNHNDGLLAGRISEYAGIDYGDARNLAEEFAASLKKKLDKGEKVVLDNIGSFVNNQEGNIQFEPDPSVNYYLDSYGLESFRFPPLEGYDVRRRVAQSTDKEQVRNKTSGKIMWRAAILIPLLAILVAVPLKTNFFKSRVETTNLNPLASAEFDNNKTAVEGKSALNPKPPSASPAPSAVKPVPAVITPSSGTNETYCLITGSFRLRENAQSQFDMLKKEGFTPEIISAPNGFFRVIAMKCNDLDKAVGKKDSIGRKYPGTWVKKII